MIFQKKKKKQKSKKPLTSQQKEQRFVKIGTRICIFLAFTFAIIFAISDTVGKLKEVPSVALNQNLSKLISGVSTSQLIYDPINNDYFDGLMTKISDAQFDIVDNDKPNYEKYMQNTINLSSDLTLNNQELALLYSYVFMFNPDTYDTIFQQLMISTTDNGYTIDIVSTIDFDTLYTSKVKNQYDAKTIQSFPKKIFLTNTMVVENGETQYLNVKYNNLTEQESLSITELISSVTDINLNEYSINLLTTFISNISTKTNSTVSYVDNCIKFSINL